MNIKKLGSLGILFVVGAVSYSCSKATSDVQYKYRKASGDGIIAKAGNVQIKEKDFYKGIELELFEAEMNIFKLKMDRLNAMLIDELIKQDPKSKGLTSDQFFQKEIAPTITVTKDEFDKFVKERKIPTSQIKPEVEQKIYAFLESQKKDTALKAWIANKTKATGVEVFFQRPLRPTYDIEIGNAPFKGGKDAKVTIVEFSDFQCPYCAQGVKIMNELKEKYGNRIKIVAKQYPLDFHTLAKTASVAALCANEQGMDMFWKMHDALFADQSKLAASEMKKTAKSLGLDSSKFDKCLDEKKYIAQVEKDIQQGREIGIKSTPTFFVNGQIVPGAQSVEVFSEIIDQLL